MQKKNVFEKVIAILLILVFVLTNLLPVANISVFAADEEKEINVDVYFSTNDEEIIKPFVANVDEENLKINIDVSVKGKGYLKSGVIALEKDTNFVIQDSNEVEIKDNEIKLKQIVQGDDEKISIPIKYEKRNAFSPDYANHDNQIVFSGIFVDNEGNENTIKKIINASLVWNEELSSVVNLEITKNIDYTISEGLQGKIVQGKLTLAGEGNKLPIENSELTIDIPQVAGMEVKNVKVETNKLAYTQGREDYDVEFGEENYSVEENKLIINVDNNAKDGKIYNSCGEDVYTITYIYEGVNQENTVITGNINSIVRSLGGTEEEKNTTVEYNYQNAIGKIVTYSAEDKIDEISKGYLMANSDAERYEIIYAERDTLNVSRFELVNSIEIADVDEYFCNEDNSIIYKSLDENSLKTIYKTTEFSEENFKNILGDNGKIEILNMNGEVIATVTSDLQADENGMYIVEYTEPITKIRIRTSKPVADGNIAIVNTKAIKKLDCPRDLIRNFSRLINVSEGYATYTDGIVDSLGTVESSVSINPTSSNATLEVSKTELETTVKNEGVNFKIRLNNNDDISDLYENPVFEIRLPNEITDVKISNIDLFYANDELKISNIETLEENNQKLIRISLEGLQTLYNLNKETNGTIISFDLDISVDEFTTNKAESILMYYYNASSSKYENEVDWSMIFEADNANYNKNGSDGVEISFKAPEGLINAQTTERKETSESEEVEEPEEKVISVKQGAKSDLIEEGAEAQLATMTIAIMNNTNKSYSGLQILGRLPFKGNKDIFTGADLGTTVDTILDSEIISVNNDLPYTVYYSENGEATNDLTDEENGWRQDYYYKTGGVKSYLIVLDPNYVLDPNTNIEFEYDYVIPANLTSGDAFFGTYATYYKEGTGSTSNASADKVGYETKKVAVVEASMNLVGEKIKEYNEFEFEILLKNTSEIDAKDGEINFILPWGISLKGVEGNNVSGGEDTNKAVKINVENVHANSEEKITLKCNAVDFEEDEKIRISAEYKSEDLDESVYFETPEYETEKTKVVLDDNLDDIEKIIAGYKYDDFLEIRNVSDNDMTNVVITKKLGNYFKFKPVDAERSGYTEEYNEETNEVTWKIEKLQKNVPCCIKYEFSVDADSSKGMRNTNEIETIYDFNDGTEPIRNVEEKMCYQPEISIIKEDSESIGFARAGDDIQYKYVLENKTNYDITNCQLSTELVGNAEINQIIINNGKEEALYSGLSSKAMNIILYAGTNAEITIDAKINEDAINGITNTLELEIGKYNKKSEVDTVLESDESGETSRIAGYAYIDANRNQQQDIEEETLSGIVVNLYNSETNENLASILTDLSGRYEFENVPKGKYYVKFKYDESEYLVSTEISDSTVENKSLVMKVNGNYVTDNINLDKKSVSNINLPLVNDNIFDMKVDLAVEKITIQNQAENTIFGQNSTKLAKVDIDPEVVSGSKVLIDYKITVKNQGTIAGKVNKLVDYLPDGMEFDSTINPDWYLESDGNLYTRALQEDTIDADESRELHLVLIKNMSDDNTGIVHNTVEIADANNDRGIPDIDSVYGNRLEEDDFAYADSIIGISTGISARTATLAIIIAIIVIFVAVLVYKEIDRRRYV